jgi:ribose transport system ATP-binding protein
MTKSNNGFLEMCGLIKDFPGVRALDHVDFSVKEGEVHCLLGENGAGKSTLIKILTGVYQPDAGEIYFLNKRLSHITPRFAQQIGISAIYQELQQASTLSIGENVFLGCETTNKFGRIDSKKLKKDTIDYFKQLDIEINPDWLISNVSIGLRQMTEVVKVLVRGGKLVIMDEPTTSLNEKETIHLFTTIKRLRQKGISVIYISHRMEEIFEVGDRASIIRDGKLIGTRDIEKVTSSEIISMMVGRTIKEKFYKEKIKFGNVLWKGFNISSEDGTVKNADIKLRGEKKTFKTTLDAINSGIGYLPDDRKGEGLILLMNVRNNIILPILNKLSNYGWVNEREAMKVANYYKENLNIQASSLEKSVEFLSGGNQQKVVLAKWLASKCKLLVLNEPTQGIDVGSKIEMYKLMANHVRNGGTILLVSSELPELLAIADRIIVMLGGRIVGEVVSSKSNQEEVLHMAAAGSIIYTRQSINGSNSNE